MTSAISKPSAFHKIRPFSRLSRPKTLWLTVFQVSARELAMALTVPREGKSTGTEYSLSFSNGFCLVWVAN